MHKCELPFLVTYERGGHEGEAAPVAAFACKGDAEEFGISLAAMPIVLKTPGVVRVTDTRTGEVVWSDVARGAPLPRT